MKCPICKGKGEIHDTSRKEVMTEYELKKSMSKILIDSGFSYRQVAKMLGYKSTNSVQYNLKSNLSK